MESEGIKYNSIWKHFNIQKNFDMCKKCKKILLGEEDLQTLRRHLNVYHQIDIFDDVKFPACTIPYLHKHFQFGIMTTCNYCCKTESYLKILDKLKIHFICFHKGTHLLTTENIYKILILSEVKCMDCFAIIYHLHRMYSSIEHLEVKHPEKLSYNETYNDKMNLKRIVTNSTLANLLGKEIEFRNKIQANRQTDCEIKQKTEEHSETLSTHHESASNISKSMDSNGWIIIDSQGKEIENEEKTNDPIDLIDTDWILL